jgi:hypothetical protein
MSCLACHQGTVAGRVIPGAPNTRYALETLTEEVRQVKLRQGKALGHMDLGGLLMPLGTTNGTTNAVMFGVALMQHRDPDLSPTTTWTLPPGGTIRSGSGSTPMPSLPRGTGC